MSPQRDRYDIIKDILEIVSNTQPLYRTWRNQTSIGYTANLTHPQTVRYLKGIIDEGLLILTKSIPYPYYEIAPKGQRCLWVFAEMEDEIRPLASEDTLIDRITYQQSTFVIISI
jgi:predicted transcriptional regulator